MIYHKLVRDKIPEIIKRKGEACEMHIASAKEFDVKLKEKLLEEVSEYLENETIEEMADIYEVLEAICARKKFEKRTVLSMKRKKQKERGAFTKRIILDAS
ncbi:MAG: nucleoside triphosphate pyrophosphohydrolase [Patescibacteria group bacterium]|jgi:predicted house-cleaning noncanonical NTP pyrophosphatase (MazG superfamily)